MASEKQTVRRMDMGPPQPQGNAGGQISGSSDDNEHKIPLFSV